MIKLRIGSRVCTMDDYGCWHADDPILQQILDDDCRRVAESIPTSEPNLHAAIAKLMAEAWGAEIVEVKRPEEDPDEDPHPDDWPEPRVY